ncbi:MAG: sugar transferase [Planctomycetota bacterium]
MTAGHAGTIPAAIPEETIPGRGILGTLATRRAVILGGGHATALFPLANHYSKTLFPLAGCTLLEHLVIALVRAGIDEVIILAPSQRMQRQTALEEIGEYLDRDVSISLVADCGIYGTAGCLRHVERSIADSPFLLVAGNVFLRRLDLAGLSDLHESNKAVLTAVVSKSSQRSLPAGRIDVDSSGQIRSVEPYSAPDGDANTPRFAGVFLCHPAVLDHLNRGGYMDLKEQLIPRLLERRLPVAASAGEVVACSIDTPHDYLGLQRDLLCNGFDPVHRGRLKSVAPGVWVGRSVQIAKSARLVGPAVIGEGCTVEDGALVQGPVSMGRRCRIESGAVVSESIIWDDVRVQRGARVVRSILADGSQAGRDRTVSDRVLIASRHARTRDPGPDGTQALVSDARRLRSWSRRATEGIAQRVKRVIDITVALVGLLVQLPLVAIVAAAIKLDSPGPVLFRQNRCGRGGREFTMYKFRTMVADAPSLQDLLRQHQKNQVDGPMFKLARDPRCTRVGRIMRRINLDELPQLWNVLKGDMSLIGPRPLARHEMRFAPAWRDLRLAVRPGLTGLWQVRGRQNGTFHDWIRDDIEYVRNWSLGLDLAIMIRTLLVILRCR